MRLQPWPVSTRPPHTLELKGLIGVWTTASLKRCQKPRNGADAHDLRNTPCVPGR